MNCSQLLCISEALPAIVAIIDSQGLLSSPSASLTSLSKHSPRFWGLFREVELDQLVTQEFCDAFRALLSVCLEVRRNWFPGNEPSQVPNAQPQISDSIDDFFRFGHYFPFHPVVRGLGRYAVDRDVSSVARREASSSSSCTKEATPPTRLTRVLLPFICLDCEQCFGFSCIDAYESPRAVFDVIFMRFVRPPQCVVYDNSCHLSLYCALREPSFFRDVSFIVDRFHARNHKLEICSTAHNAQLDSRLDRYNTQLMEQLNSRFKELSVALRYCAPGSYLATMIISIFKDNRDREINLHHCPQYRLRIERAQALADIGAR